MEVSAIFTLVSVVILLTMVGTEATEYFVSIDGDGNNPGTLEKPWKHIQKATTVLSAGDICTIRGGRYSEEVTINGLQGTQDKPIIFRSYPGETVTFDGTVPITSSWEKYKDDIYVTTLEEDIWQLFVDGEMQVNARWPNAFWYDYSVFNYTKWAFGDAKSTFNPATGKGVLVDNGTQGLAKSRVNASGAITILNIGSWLTWAGLVTEHTPGEDNFSFDIQQMLSGVIKFHGQASRYFLEDKLEFLDAPSEWFYDAVTKKLYLWTINSDEPSKYDICGKVSTYAFTITNSSAWLTLSDFNFFASTVFIRGMNGQSDVNNIRLESLYFSYPSYSKRMLGSLAVPNMTTIYYNGLQTEYAGNFSVFNCTWEYADGQTMLYRGADGVFQNNLWHHNDFTCVGNGALFSSEGVRDHFIRNTVHSNGPSIGFSPGNGNAKDRQLGMPIGADVRLNIFYDLKYLQDDGAHVQTRIAAQNGTVLEYNWSFDTMKYGLRFDRSTAENAPWGYNGTVRYNIIWGTRGLMIKGDYHHVENNLCFDNNQLPYDLALLGYPGKGAKGEDIHTVTTGNILQHGACADYNTPNCTYIPGNFTNNAIEDVRKALRDPDNLDFRPVKGSDYFSKGIGPYGNESVHPLVGKSRDPSTGPVYWIPGRQEVLASTPIPPNGTTTAKCDADLMWLAAYNAEAHYVYFNTNRTAVVTADTTSDILIGVLKTPANVVAPSIKLKPNLTYYWRVDGLSKNLNDIDVGENKGNIWQFECKN